MQVLLDRIRANLPKRPDPVSIPDPDTDRRRDRAPYRGEDCSVFVLGQRGVRVMTLTPLGINLALPLPPGKGRSHDSDPVGRFGVNLTPVREKVPAVPVRISDSNTSPQAGRVGMESISPAGEATPPLVTAPLVTR